MDAPSSRQFTLSPPDQLSGEHRGQWQRWGSSTEPERHERYNGLFFALLFWTEVHRIAMFLDLHLIPQFVYTMVNHFGSCNGQLQDFYLRQGTPALFLESYYPTDFSSKPNQTNSLQLIKVFRALSYFWEIWGSSLLSIGESVTVDWDHVCLNNQSHHSLDVTEFQSRVLTVNHRLQIL